MVLFGGVSDKDFGEFIGEVVKIKEDTEKSIKEIKDAILSIGARVSAIEKWSNDTQKYMEARDKIEEEIEPDLKNLPQGKLDKIIELLGRKTSEENEEEEEPKRDKYFATKGHCDNCDKKVTLEAPFDEFTTNKGRKNKLRGRCSECGEAVEIEVK